MLNSMPDSKSTCMSFVYSMKKRNVKMSVSTRPKKKPLPTGLVESGESLFSLPFIVPLALWRGVRGEAGLGVGFLASLIRPEHHEDKAEVG